MKKAFSILLLCMLLFGMAALPVSAEEAGWDFSDEYPDAEPTGVTINVYNWGEYIANGTEGSLDISSRGAPASRSTTRRSTATNRCTRSSRAAARTTTSSSPPTT